ncbi:MAG: ABC transporter substrate-binding protein, partial [Devosiaceae bacterium]|nr:ABC transporter substrate-binding protein [Devosiaceae bacterium]
MPPFAKIFSILAAFALSVSPLAAADPDPNDWDSVLAEAKGQEVFWHAWGGAQNINAYIAWVGQEVQSRYGVKLTQVKISETANVVARVLAEFEAGRTENGAVDLVWVNGENFATLKRQGLLLSSPWSTFLPNYALTDFENKPVLTSDFTTPVDGLESPWGTAQLTFYYDSAIVPTAPDSLAALEEWIQKNPGRFTYAAPPNFIGTTFLKQVLLGLTSDHSVFKTAPDATVFEATTAPLWAWL